MVLAVDVSSQQTFIETALSKEEPEMFAKGNLTYSAVQLPDRVEMNANDSVKAAKAHLEFMRKLHSLAYAIRSGS